MEKTRKWSYLTFKYKKIFGNFIAYFLLLVVFHQVSFLLISFFTANKTLLGVQGLLRQQFVDSNPYKVAQTLNDLENLGFMKCSKLINEKQDSVYIDLSYRQDQNDCEVNYIYLNGIREEIVLLGINNMKWKVQFLSVNDSIFHWARIISLLLLVIIFLFSFYLKVNDIIREEKIRNLENEKWKLHFELAKQVAHDIRSPLAALNMAMKDLSNIPEEKRIIIRGSVNRMQDIANDLLSQSRASRDRARKPQMMESESLNVQLVSSLLDAIVTEKRMQFRSMLGVEIELYSGSNSYGSFAKIQSHGFKRVISNLINNSVEALGNSGRVLIELSGSDENIQIKIKDNGNGIPPEILQKIGRQGETHGKKEGNGIGLYHAFKIIEEWKGKLSIESEVGLGTILTIVLPKAETPSWFVPELRLAKNGHIVVLDDDSTIHQIWDGRFNEMRINQLGIMVHHFSIPSQVIEWVEQNKSSINVIYLFDYELIGQKMNGLQLIEKLNLGKEAILVTSRYEEKGILEKCQEMGIKLIPKNMAESVPITISESQADLRILDGSGCYDIVYVDDDKYLRWGWENSAKFKGIKLLTLGSTVEFGKYSAEISPNAIFYIDRELGENEPKGEVWAKELFEMGYRNLYLATGYDESYFPPMNWISGFIGKDPPWESEEEF